MPWYIEKKAPLGPGHELSGDIAATGRGVTGYREGDRVFVHHHAPCMECFFCRRMNFVQCETWKTSRIVPGGIAEYVLVPEINLKHDTLRIPDTMSYEDASLIEPLACVVKSLHRSGFRPGDAVLVMGLGVMGMMHILLARHLGAGKVIGADMTAFRLQKARDLGADAVIDVRSSPVRESTLSLTENRGADIVIVGPNSAKAMKEGLQAVAPGGTALFFTPAKPGEKLTLDPNALYFRDITIVNSYSCGPDHTRQALEIISGGAVSAEKLVTHRLPIEDTAMGFRLVAEARESLKVLIIFP
jgi:L-iditol 2-dehydrogenase